MDAVLNTSRFVGLRIHNLPSCMVFCILLKPKLPCSITFEMILKWDLMSRFGIVTYKMVQEPIHHHMSTHRNSLSRPRMPKVDFEKMWQGQFDPPHFHPFPPFPRPHGVPARKLLLLLHCAHQVVLDESSKVCREKSRAFEVSKQQKSNPSICISMHFPCKFDVFLVCRSDSRHPPLNLDSEALGAVLLSCTQRDKGRINSLDSMKPLPSVS